MKRCDVAIIGGGFAGVYSAWRLAREGVSTILIESSDHLGGSMWSWDWRGFLVDQGTHNFDLRSKIGADFYSDILASNLAESDKVDWSSTIDRTWTHGFEMPDFGEDDPALCASALRELGEILSSPKSTEVMNYDEWLSTNFGLTLAARLKIMVEKTIGHSSSRLAVEAREPLGMFTRPKLGSNDDMITLKASNTFYNDRLGVSFPCNDSRFLGRTNVRKFGYPKKGALRAFCIAVERRLNDLGVCIAKNTRVEGINPESGSLTLRTDRGLVHASRAFWTLPDHGLNSLLGIDIDTRKVALPVGSAFYAFEINQRDILGPSYLHDFSSARKPYRYNSCGLYSDQIRSDGTTFVMAEVPSHPANLSSLLNADVASRVWDNFREVGFVRSNADCKATGFWTLPVTYTLPLVGWQGPLEQTRQAIRSVSDRISTIAFGHRGRHSFMLHYDKDLQHELKGIEL